MRTPDGFVSLDRVFLDIEDKPDREEAAFLSYVAGLSPGITWSQLVGSQVAVILGEAGSGKTWECMSQCVALRESGVPAFYIRLDALATMGFDAALDPVDQVAFKQWMRSGGDTAHFFLDSVDEAKLTGPNAFHNALNAFLVGLSDIPPARLHVVITSRVSEWRGNADLEKVRDRFNLPKQEQSERHFSLDSDDDQSPPLCKRCTNPIVAR